MGIKWDLIPAPLAPTQGFSPRVMKSFLCPAPVRKEGNGNWVCVGQWENIAQPVPAFHSPEGSLVMSTAEWFWGMSGQGSHPFGSAHVLPYISTASPSHLESSAESKPNFVQPSALLDEHGCLRLIQLQMRATAPSNPALSSFAWRLHDPLLNMHMNWDATNFPGVSWGLK